MQKITLPEKPKIIEQEGNFAVFEIKSCYPGYGTTIGNALRRVLFSSLVGCAVTSVKINGVNHEFSTIQGVMEDVVEIILNLKKVRFKMHVDGPVKLTCKANGEGEVTASNIKTTSDVEIVNKNAHIATITDKNSKLEMEIKVEKGIGYVPLEQQSEEKLEIGTIAVDAIYTPVTRVNYKVENMRVGKMTNYDKLILEIETDGSITSQEAFEEACRLLVEHFSLLQGIGMKKEIAVEKKEEKEEEIVISEKETTAKIREREVAVKEEQKEDTLKIAVESLGISPRIQNLLTENKIKTVGKLVKKSEEELREISGMGDKGMKEIKKAIGKLGLTLKGN